MIENVSRRNFLSGLVAAPAILKLGLWMPVKGIRWAESLADAVRVPLTQIVTFNISVGVVDADLITADLERFLQACTVKNIRRMKPGENDTIFVDMPKVEFELTTD